MHQYHLTIAICWRTLQLVYPTLIARVIQPLPIVVNNSQSCFIGQAIIELKIIYVNDIRSPIQDGIIIADMF